MEKTKKVYFRYGISFLLGGAVVLSFALASGVPNIYGAELFRVLSDAFFLPSVIFLSIFALSFISATGFFDIITYSLGRLFFPGRRIEGYMEYKGRKERKNFDEYSFLCYTGIAFLLPSLLFYMLFYAF